MLHDDHVLIIGTLIYLAAASGNLGSFASAYIAAGNLFGSPVSNKDTYLAAMIMDDAWSGQVANVTADLLPTNEFQINGNNKEGNALNNYETQLYTIHT